MILLLYGLVPAIALLVIIFLLKRKQTPLLPYYQNMWIRTWILVILATGLYLIPLSTQIRIQHWDDPQLARLKYRSYSNPENEAYRQALVEYIDKKAQ
ncbi:hypothetical protein GXP67_16085 [Rhodocytophaga rosea]|uniref:Uncharacterized protein n=1 Tax=Rhodocytophaga rosea TaxID=2704465 RepID=A0A6C0GJ11_9BACT|nr:hypothetical protein [Rhodocytophaga rosea]QHT68051.1 hypothetical protein GXP67_16085 [Rhodocytophaga rosea]